MERLSFSAAQRKVGIFQSVMIAAVMGAVALNTYCMWQELAIPHSFLSICVYIITGHLNNIDTMNIVIVKNNHRQKRVTGIDLDNIQERLVAYDKLLLLCNEDISTSYGVVFVLITFISTLDITFIVYILNMTTAVGYLQTIGSTVKTAFFALPSIIFLCMMFLGSDIQEQVS
ncbi:unnamed protein product [Ceratitis capitata]|uniref:(Mediterranean fruit fly) hypothetical protein n=1 Tax=Ceratitis capitata TaxID=7213 RepID=A0A811UE57_CERCA|nr:unnamed protein product [Ceratitis capitata]